MENHNASDQTNLIVDIQKSPTNHWYEDLLFLKIYPLMKVAQDTQLNSNDFDDNFQLPTALNCYEDFQAFKKNQGSVKLETILLKFFCVRLLKIYLLQLIQLGCQLSMAIIIKLVLEYISSNEKDHQEGWFLTLLILFVRITSLLSESHSKLMIKQAGYDAMSIVSMNIMSKSLRISLLSNNKRTIGEITNLLQADAQQLINVTSNLTNVAIIPILLAISLWYIYKEVGITVFVGIAIIIVTLIINQYFGKYLLNSQKMVLRSKDARIKQTNEVFQQIKFIKINSFEKIFQQKIEELRKEEMKSIEQRFNFFAWNIFIGWLSPQLIQSLSFGLYVYLGNTLTPGIVFPMISLLLMLAVSLQNLPVSINQVLDTKLSLKRIQCFLETDELMLKCIEWYDFQDPKLSIQIQNGNFYWNQAQIEAKENVILKDICLNIEPQKFISIIGDIGSGKTSIIQLLLGEMLYDQNFEHLPKVIIQGSLAYIGQRAWIQNATVRENILFGKQYHKESYEKAIYYSCLQKDMEILIHKDQTMIGEKGINLSGGQKARISLARALYSDADIYLLDDPLSAVDVHVANFIMQECFLNYLKQKTRILCTHMIQFCKYTDYVYFLQNGGILSQGDYQSIMQLEKFQDIEKKFKEQDTEQDVIDDKIIVKTTQTIMKSNDAMQGKQYSKNEQENLMLKEDQQEGEIEFSVFKQYFLYNEGCKNYTALIFIMGLQIFSQIISTIWLAQWSTVQVSEKQYDDTEYWTVYFVLGVFQAIFAFSRVIVINSQSLKSSTLIHNKVINSLLQAPLCNFFERVPVGRIMNRLTKDINSLDIEISMNIRVFSMKLGQVISSSLIAIITSTKLIIFPCLLFFYISLKIQRIYMKASRELQRLELVSKSPVLSYFVESLQGLTVIRAFKKEDQFIQNFGNKLDKNRQIVYVSTIANCWFSQFLGLSSLIVNMTAISYCIFYSSNAGFAGLIFTYVSSLDVSIQQTIDSLSLLENNMISFERCLEFTNIPQEKLDNTIERVKNWPTKGVIKFQNISVKYRANLPNALQNFSFVINSAEKIGIVGRTGAGKSTIALSLLKILEVGEGQILIDDTNIQSVPLQQLRESLTTILQDATIFHGSIRHNLDPLSLCNDKEILQVINDCCLNKLLENRNGLDTLVDEGGDNLSAGEKQLICIARAILKKSKIIIIDEATANIDEETEKKIQDTIEKAFKNCTVITIAHRISTIMRCDRILVIENGQIAESGKTQELLNDSNSLFYQVYQEVRKNSTYM